MFQLAKTIWGQLLHHNISIVSCMCKTTADRCDTLVWLIANIDLCADRDNASFIFQVVACDEQHAAVGRVKVVREAGLRALDRILP